MSNNSTRYTNNIYNCKHLILSGGGTKGFTYIGLIRLIHEYGIYNQLETIIGFSVGSIFSIAILLGLTYKESIDIITEDNFFQGLVAVDTNDVLNFSNNKGLTNGDNIKKFVKRIIYLKTGKDNLTFLESYEKFNKIIAICVTNVTNKNTELLSYKNCPNLDIADAIVMSCAMPLVFVPIKYNGCIYVDGDMSTDCKNNPNFFRELYNIDELVNQKYKSMLQETDNNDNNNDNNTDNTSNIEHNNNTNNTNNSSTHEFIIKHELSLKNTIEKEIIEEYFNNTLTIYLKKETKNYNSSNFEQCSLMEYISMLYDVSVKMGYKIDYNYLNNSVFIYLPNQLGSFINFNIETEDIINTINIGYSVLKKNIESSPNFNNDEK